ncbi:unnamed protein product [Ilex paraguariensis]|uniref:non-specific serine/threonine protein kinase n=1 Tax=Ilex paraguariensis TaxID=185542 RepID=A0ABC8TI32_9AQUA
MPCVAMQKQSWPNQLSFSSLGEHDQSLIKSEPDLLTIPGDGTDVWEIDPRFLKFESKIASGSYGDLYRGTYRTQEVAIKVLKAECVSSDVQREFAQEVYIMRKVRHKNVVQFIGACTKPPSLCIVTEYMSGGSVYDYLHKLKGTFKLPSLLKVAIDISKGMNYLHQHNIIHRDLKAANLLMDENEVVKVADFGVARVKAQTGVMTAETGTYRWMAPEPHQSSHFDDLLSLATQLCDLCHMNTAVLTSLISIPSHLEGVLKMCKMNKCEAVVKTWFDSRLRNLLFLAFQQLASILSQGYDVFVLVREYSIGEESLVKQYDSMVIEHKSYDHKADVFSFGIVLWELLTGKLPYEYLTPLQAAVGVVQKGLRPTIPKQAHPKLAELLERCWRCDPTLRPDFSVITEILQQIAKEVGDAGEDRHKDKSSGGFLSILRRGHH